MQKIYKGADLKAQLTVPQTVPSDIKSVKLKVFTDKSAFVEIESGSKDKDGCRVNIGTTGIIIFIPSNILSQIPDGILSYEGIITIKDPDFGEIKNVTAGSLGVNLKTL